MKSELEQTKVLFKQLLHAESYSFPQKGKIFETDKGQGVYIIYDAKNVVLHVGKTTYAKGGLGQRLKNHLQGKSSFTRVHLEGKGATLKDGYTFKYIEVENPRARALLEYYALSHLCPVHMGVGEKRIEE